MNDRAAVLFEAYDFELRDIKKGRGMLIADTGIGQIALKEYTGTQAKAEWLEAYTKRLKESGYPKIEGLFRDRKDNLIQTDYEGTRYLVKEFTPGRECVVSDKSQCRQACQEIAKLHKAMKEAAAKPLTIQHKVVLPVTVSDEDEQPLPQEEQYELLELAETDAQYDMMIRKGEGFISGEYEKRIGEMHRARQFIRKNRSKNDFDLLFLKEYDRFYEQAMETCCVLSTAEKSMLEKKVLREKQYCHGDMNHHNIMFCNKELMIQNFEKMRPDFQIKDLYLFVRKICEKNNWSFELGKLCIDAYSEKMELTVQEHKLLYASFLFPEKYCKIANGYMGQKKALPPKRQWDKLQSLLQMETLKQAFLKAYKETYLS